MSPAPGDMSAHFKRTKRQLCVSCRHLVEAGAKRCPYDGGELRIFDSPEDLVGRVLDDRLTLTEVLGKGGMGVVYLARRHADGDEVAVKVLRPELANEEATGRFMREARAVTTVAHPNLIAVHDVGNSPDGLLYLVMERLEGHTLVTELRERALPLARAMRVLSQVSAGLTHAHERGLVHRDLTPSNIFLTTSGHVKILDFGLAIVQQRQGLERVTKTGTVCGTPAYMSPEQVLGDRIDGRADQFSLGVVAFETLTGRHPFPAQSAMRQLMLQLDAVMPPFADVEADHLPVSLERVLRRALEKEPADRYATAAAFADALNEAADSGVETAPTTVTSPAARVLAETVQAASPTRRAPPSSTAREATPQRAGRGLWLAVGAVVLVAAVLAIVLSLAGG